jgi:hypothetical protein
VRNNPVNFNDPTGHCSGDPNDSNNPDIACWQMIWKIQGTYQNVHVKNQDRWILSELNAIWDALLGHIFIEDILTASGINLYRESFYSSRLDGIGGSTINKNGFYNVTIYDFAYQMPPDDRGIGSPSIRNFEGVIIHELAHVAMGQNPFIEESYSKRSVWLNYPEALLPITIGEAYPCSSNCSAEMIAIAASTWQLDPASFSGNILFISYTDWRESWIELFYNPNPFAKATYGPTYLTSSR